MSLRLVAGGAGQPVPLPTDPDLSSTVDDFVRSMVAESASITTIKERRTVVVALGQYLGIDPRTASSDQIVDWLGRPGLAAWTRATYYGHLRAWFTWLEFSGRRPDNPTHRVKRPRSGRTQPRPLSADEVGRLLADAGPRMHTWLILGLYAGLRAHEIAKIRGSDVRLDELFVLGKGNQGRLLPTHPLIWAEAQRYGQGFWFPSRVRQGEPIQGTWVSTMSGTYFEAHGVEGAIHRCRHTYGTRLLRDGANIRVVQELMRHESLATTARYTAVDEAEKRAAVLGLLG